MLQQEGWGPEIARELEELKHLKDDVAAREKQLGLAESSLVEREARLLQEKGRMQAEQEGFAKLIQAQLQIRTPVDDSAKVLSLGKSRPRKASKKLDKSQISAPLESGLSAVTEGLPDPRGGM